MTKHGMASAADSSSSAQITLNLGNASPLSITCHKLNGRNFLPWSQSVLTYICGRCKEEFLTGSVQRPDSNDQKFRSWKADNNLVMSWLINSLTPEIGENFLFYSSVYEIWEAARETYSCKDNTAELFAIESAIHDLRQDDYTVTEYFSALTRHWQKIDLTGAHDWKCSRDEKLYKVIIENKRVLKFLMSLHNSLDDVQSRVLSTKPLPSLRTAFSEVRQEESRRKVMLGSSLNTSTSSDSSALALHRQYQSPSSEGSASKGLHNGQPLSNIKGKMIQRRLWCDVCKKPSHNIDTCWKIHGKPADWKPARERRAHTAASDQPPSAPVPFTKEQMDVLHKLFMQQKTPSASLISGMGSTAIPEE